MTPAVIDRILRNAISSHRILAARRREIAQEFACLTDGLRRIEDAMLHEEWIAEQVSKEILSGPKRVSGDTLAVLRAAAQLRRIAS